MVAHPVQISNQLIEDTRDLTQIWDLYGDQVAAQKVEEVMYFDLITTLT